MISFENKIALVTGASSGIGRATAVTFAHSGASVAAVGRDATALEDVVAECQHAGVAAIAIVTDLTSSSGPEEAVQHAVARFGGLDVLVNAAGIIAMGTTDATSDDDWDRVMELNVRTPF